MHNLNKIIYKLSVIALVLSFTQAAFSKTKDELFLEELNKQNEEGREELAKGEEDLEQAQKSTPPPIAVPLYGELPQVSQTFAVTASNLTAQFYTKYPNVMGRITSYLMQALIVNTNAEVGGRFARALEFGGNLDRVSYSPIFIFGGYCSVCILPSASTPQQLATVSIAPREQNRLFTDAIIMRSLRRETPISPSQSVATFFSTTDQLTSVYITNNKDVSTYVDSINATYGVSTISKKEVQAVAWLELLNPLIYTSIYSSVMNEDNPLKVFDIGGFKVMPSVQVILTPYGAIEKRLVTYMPRGPKNFTFSFGFGRDALDRQTYFVEYGLDNIGSIWGINFGGAATLWRQPDLFASDPRASPMRLGIMGQLKADYLIKDYLGLHAELMCKTAGFVQGQPNKRGCTTLIATQFQW